MEKEPQTSSGSMLIVSGPPGAGKSTVARTLAETAERPTVHLAIDQFYVAIRKGFVLPFLPAAARQNETVNDVVVAAAAGYAGGGYDVVIDGIVGPWSLPVFVAGAQQFAVSLSLVVLRPTLSDVLNRATQRAGNALKDSGPIRGLYGAFQSIGELERFVLDTSAVSEEATVTLVRECFASDRYRLG